MHATDPYSILPHRYPFAMLDRIIECEPGVRAAALRRVTENDPFRLQVLYVEAMAQLAGVAVGGEEGEGGFLAAVEHAESFGAMEPGETLTISVTLLKSFGRLHLFRGEVTGHSGLLAEATFTIGIGPLK
ncbi:MAG TPA: hydroxymyristoyl-ACP dehydratase [Verrucomicrobiae bacterium]|nr:hydroxymyristoyl-ACP dehydratase [Verrucomicrobiae bacterium]